MPAIHKALRAAVFMLATTTSVQAGENFSGDMVAGWDWLATTNEIQTEGVFWNDRYGDGKDRWKTSGITRSCVFPERIFSNSRWLEGRASALEVNVRALLMTPDDTSFERVDSDDRPYAQYAGAGIYLRTITRPERLTPALTTQAEDRTGVEVGWQGDPLPLFDIQSSLHDMTGSGGDAGNLSNIIDGELLVNLDARRTWRLHMDGVGRDLEFAPFVQTSLGMRENSLRAGGDFFIGSTLEGRIWGSNLSTGAVLAGASAPRQGFNWPGVQLDRLLRWRCRLCSVGRLARRRLRGEPAQCIAQRNRRPGAERTVAGTRQRRHQLFAQLAWPGVFWSVRRSGVGAIQLKYHL